MELLELNKGFVQEYAQKNNISLHRLAIQIGLSPSMMWRVMNGERKPGPKMISLMLLYFNEEFERLFHNDVVTKVYDKGVGLHAD